MGKPHVMLTWSASELAAAIRDGQFSSLDAVQAHYDYLDQVNPVLNAVVFQRRDDALREAVEADDAIARARENGTLDQLPPLLGVPCTIKENFAFVGTPQASGLLKRAHIINDHDAPTVARLREAGAIPLGVTNTSELCMWMESFNKVYGITNNPYDRRRTVGGSSGGEGAIIGSGASPFGLGADVGGSIRMPAFFNGVFGHKPSPLLIPNEGQYPAAKGEANRVLGTGPLCRRATDLEVLVRVLAGDQAGRLKDPASVDFSQLRVLTVTPERGPKMSADQQAARDKAVQALVDNGARAQAVDLPAIDKAFDIWSAMLAEADSENSFSDMMFGTRNPLRGIGELFRLMVGRSPHTLPLILLATGERISELAPRRHRKLVAMGEALKAQLHELLGDDGVLVHPPYPTVAPKHYKALWPPFNFVHCAIFNTMQVPSTSVPMGLDSNGIPTGVQVVAGPEQDHLGIACALALETAVGGWVPPWTA
ncbi:MAG: amidase [Alcanivoracaceae bacterium]|nr:amidase [Alcanivoracaceae bacterium]